MAKYGQPRFDIIKVLQNDIALLKERVRQLENAKTVTVPVYRKAALGDRDLVLGQVFVGIDNSMNYVGGTPDNVVVYELNGTLFTTQ